ncbi:MAG: family 16 glycoside hydrolase [Chloroflexia bacterium]
MRKRAWLFPLLALGVIGLLACGQSAEPLPLQGTPQSSIPPAPAVAAPAGEILVQDAFSGPLSEVWAVLDTVERPGERAEWHTQDDMLVQGGTTLGHTSPDAAYLVVQSGGEWSDYILRVAVYVESNDEVGVVFRVNDDGFYRFRMRSADFDGPYHVGLDRFQDGRYTVLWHEAGNGFPIRQWFTLEVEARGDRFRISVDGRLLTEVQDSAFVRGSIGLYAWAEGGAYFDNLVVTR